MGLLASSWRWTYLVPPRHFLDPVHLASSAPFTGPSLRPRPLAQATNQTAMLRFARPSRVVRSIAARRTFAATPRASLPPRPSAKDDPWAMPLAPENVNPERDPPGTAPREQDIDLSDPNLPFPEPLSREGESMEQLRARLVYQTRKRGTLESDLIMSTFAKQHMADMSEVELKEFDRVRSADVGHTLSPSLLTLYRILFIVCNASDLWLTPHLSCSTRTTGIPSTGPRASASLLSAGRTPSSSKSSQNMHVTRRRLRAACLHCRRAATLSGTGLCALSSSHEF
jgi:hypothetical protein